jgi:acyl-CoA synthetase (AMP-forming)/AMP-acid ligase II
VLLDGRSLGARTQRAEDGELLVSGPQFFLGYGSEGKFAAREEWFPTGDIFAWEQEYKFVSRKRDLIDIGGRKIPPALIEEIFSGMPELNECLAFPVTIQGVERVGLIYTRKAGCGITREELAQNVSERSRTSLSLDMRPFWWREMDSLPRLPNGKVSRIKARDLYAGDGKGDTSPSSPSPSRP